MRRELIRLGYDPDGTDEDGVSFEQMVEKRAKAQQR